MENNLDFKCPVCGDFYFEAEDDHKQCPICGWINDSFETNNPDCKVKVNELCLNDYKKVFVRLTTANPDYTYKEFMAKSMRHACPVCKKYKFVGIGTYDICPLCGWHDDTVQEENPTYTGGVNELCLNDYKKEYELKIYDDPKYAYIYHNQELTKHKCPICGKGKFKGKSSYEECKVCGWVSDPLQEVMVDLNNRRNKKSFNEFKADYLATLKKK